MTSLHTILLTTFYSVSVIAPSQCNNSSAKATKTAATSISKIAYSSTGGRGGNYESLDLSPDSLIYVQARRGDEKMVKEKTAAQDWETLTHTINLEDFDKIRSNPGHALYDGIDITIAIESGNEKHAVVNGNEDTVNYKQIKPFTELLENKLAELRKKIVR